MSGTLALSSLLASLDRAGLVGLIRARYIASPNSVHDPIDLASELLRPESISRALTLLGRDELRALLVPDEAVDPELRQRLLPLGLLDSTGAPLPEVSRTLCSMLESHGLEASDLETAPTAAPRRATAPGTGDAEPGADTADTSGWFAAALTTTAQAAWLLREIERGPAKLNRNASIASVWVRAYEERTGVPRVAELVELLRAAGLAVPQGTELHADAAEWLLLAQEQRWAVLARTAIELMPPQVLSLLPEAASGDSISSVAETLHELFPLTTEAVSSRVASAAALWERLGITVSGRLSEAGLAALRGEARSLGLPDPVPGIYIQPDLSVIIPGPLSASDEAGLAAIAAPEQLGVASTLRISEASLGEAFERGASASDIRELLERLSLTGIPQPLEYLVRALEGRAGSVVVSQHDGDEGRTRIDFLQAGLRPTVLVDRNLAHLQLREAEGDSYTSGAAAPLFSRLRPEHVLAALTDARYPAVAGGGAAAIHIPDPMPGDGSEHEQRAEEETEDPAVVIAERVLAATADGHGDISRQVTLAVRDRSPIRVTVEMRGEVRDFTVVPVSLAAGRVRALDEAAGVERTLPLEAITAITQLG